MDEVVLHLNRALDGTEVAPLEGVLSRVGRGGALPHWYAQLRDSRSLPNLDGKTVGSVVEMLLLAVLEVYILKDLGAPELRVNPARGVDFPDLDLSVKAPSTNFCTSEPFFSAYERLLGSEYDAVVLVTDYQERKNTPPLRLQITNCSYLTKTQIADCRLSALAKKHREWLIRENEAWAKRVFRFLAFVNQSDWRAARLLKLIENLDSREGMAAVVAAAEVDHAAMNARRAARNRELMPDEELTALQSVMDVAPVHVGVLDALDNWVTDNLGEAARLPNDNEWARLARGPLDGRIGMSFALQWRYNFGQVFGAATPAEAGPDDE